MTSLFDLADLTVRPRNEEGNLALVSEDLQLLTDLFRHEGIVRLLDSHLDEMLAKLVQRKITVMIRATIYELPDDLLPGAAHFR
jgi:hypothetical protein